MTGLYVLMSVCILLLFLVSILLIIVLKKSGVKNNSNITKDDLIIQNKDVKDSIVNNLSKNDAVLDATIKMQNSTVKDLSSRVDNLYVGINNSIGQLRDSISLSLKDVKDSNERNLKSIKDDNAKQLDEVKKTVSEKLDSTLDQRFTESFKIVSSRLEEINKTFVELQNLQGDVNDLSKIFKNVKTRGTWGEVSLDNLLSQILAPSQYEKQYKVKRGLNEMVDFVIKMPGVGDGEVMLPIDAKFPIEDYARLQAASDKGNVEEIEKTLKALLVRVKEEAASIKDKYVNPPKTTDFAIMYLPTEGLYAEVIKQEGFVEHIQNKYRIVICGPTTIAALLNSLQMGFKSVAVEKRSVEISKLLTSFSSEFDKFIDLLRKTGDKLSGIQRTISEAESKSEKIKQKLSSIHTGGDESLNLELESNNDELLIESQSEE